MKKATYLRTEPGFPGCDGEWASMCLERHASRACTGDMPCGHVTRDMPGGHAARDMPAMHATGDMSAGRCSFPTHTRTHKVGNVLCSFDALINLAELTC